MIASLDDAAILLGCAPLLIPPAWRNTLIDVRKQLSKRGPLTRADLFEYDLEIRDLYHEIADTLRHPAPPRLTNTDGDRLEPTTLEYGLRCSPGSAYERLKPLTMSEDDEELVADAEREPDGELRTVHLTWLTKGNRQHKTWDNTVLGTLQIEQSRPSASARRPGVAPSSARIVGGCQEGSRRSPRCAQCVMPYIR